MSSLEATKPAPLERVKGCLKNNGAARGVEAR
jgi:hypothetical protein